MTLQKKIYEGKAKTIFSGPQENTLIQYFKDDATAFNAKKFKVLEGKGEINNLISEHLMKILSNNQIPNHFIKHLDAILAWAFHFAPLLRCRKIHAPSL